MPKFITPVPRFNTTKSTSDPAYLIISMIFQLRKGERLKYATGVKILEKKWDRKTQRAYSRKNETTYNDINTELNKISTVTLDIWNNNKSIKVQELREELDIQIGRKERSEDKIKIPTLFESIEQFIDREKKGNVSDATWKKYLTVFNHMKNYAADKKLKLNYDSIDVPFKKDFEQWLYSSQNHSANHVKKIISIIKRFMNEAYNNGYHNNLKYQLSNQFKVKKVETKNKVRLTFKELEQLMKFDLSDNKPLEKARDLFIVGCYSGLRHSDWTTINEETIYDDNGTTMARVITQKTKTEVLITITPEIKNILEKYDYLLPEMPQQNFNKYIKIACEKAEINKKFTRIYNEGGVTKNEVLKKFEKVSSHAARRSFATNYFEAGVPANILMQVTGHSTERQFFEYIDVSKEDLARQFAKEAKTIRKGNLRIAK